MAAPVGDEVGDEVSDDVGDEAVPDQAAVESPVAAPVEAPFPEPVVPPPAVHEPVAATIQTREPELAVGDTPLSAIERLAAPVDLSPRIRRRDRLLTAAWAASFAALAAFCVAGYTQRDRLMQEWPASKRVYATLGLLPIDMKAGEAKNGPEARSP
jgi:hypothetical protein